MKIGYIYGGQITEQPLEAGTNNITTTIGGVLNWITSLNREEI